MSRAGGVVPCQTTLAERAMDSTYASCGVCGLLLSPGRLLLLPCRGSDVLDWCSAGALGGCGPLERIGVSADMSASE